jgi:transposase
MERGKTSTAIAGVDVGKRWLDAATHGCGLEVRMANDTSGVKRLIGWLQSCGVSRVGLEATAGYERPLVEALRVAGFEVVLHQPLEVRLFARLKRLKAKNDRLDARLIAAATAQVDAVKAAADPRLADLAERLSAYEQVCNQAAQMKGFLEHVRAKDLLKTFKAQIAQLARWKAALLADILARIRAHADLARRLDLLLSLPGVGPANAASLVVRMPELGQMKRGQAAALLGVAPFDRDSGQWKGQRTIAGGRRRPRRLLYMAALTARRRDPALRAFADALVQRGKPAKVAIVAVMRKLIEAANLVIQRNQPWLACP